MDPNKKAALLEGAVIAVIILMVLVFAMFLATGCARSEDRNNPLDPKSITYVTPTPSP